VAKQTLIESWVVATRPRDANGFGYSAQFAAEGISKIKRLFYLLAETDDIYPAWEILFCPRKCSERTLTTRGWSPRRRFTTSAESSHSIPAILGGMRVFRFFIRTKFWPSRETEYAAFPQKHTPRSFCDRSFLAFTRV
jgi:hypothetical protein